MFILLVCVLHNYIYGCFYIKNYYIIQPRNSLKIQIEI